MHDPPHTTEQVTRQLVSQAEQFAINYHLHYVRSVAVVTAFSVPKHENAQPVEQPSLHALVQFVVHVLEHCELQLEHVREQPEHEFLHAP